jgi:hypothetical protein
VQKSASPQNTSHNGLAWLQRQAIAQMTKKEFQAFVFGTQFIITSSIPGIFGCNYLT